MDDTFISNRTCKVISRDGDTMTLVFSGVRVADTTYDAFCTRTIRLQLAR